MRSHPIEFVVLSGVSCISGITRHHTNQEHKSYINSIQGDTFIHFCNTDHNIKRRIEKGAGQVFVYSVIIIDPGLMKSLESGWVLPTEQLSQLQGGITIAVCLTVREVPI